MLQIAVESPFSDHITSRWCVEHIRGVLHFLLYHRMQIPVPYLTLGLLVEQLKTGQQESAKNFFLDKQRTEAVHTHRQVEELARSLETQVISQGLDIDTAAIAFGPTAILAKEVYFISLPAIDRDHKNENHLESLQRTVANTMLALVTDNRLSSVFSSSLPLTNVHVLVRPRIESAVRNNLGNLEEISNFQLPRSCKTFLINLSGRKPSGNFISCRCVETEIRIYNELDCGLEVQCSQMTITDETTTINSSPPESLASISSGRWFQLDTKVKGFKDVLSNGRKIWAS